MSDLPTELDAWILEALRSEGLHESYARLLRSYVEDRRDQWRVCCGSDCDPCSMTLARAVDRVRARVDGGDSG